MTTALDPREDLLRERLRSLGTALEAVDLASASHPARRAGARRRPLVAVAAALLLLLGATAVLAARRQDDAVRVRSDISVPETRPSGPPTAAGILREVLERSHAVLGARFPSDAVAAAVRGEEERRDELEPAIRAYVEQLEGRDRGEATDLRWDDLLSARGTMRDGSLLDVQVLAVGTLPSSARRPPDRGAFRTGLRQVSEPWDDVTVWARATDSLRFDYVEVHARDRVVGFEVTGDAALRTEQAINLAGLATVDRGVGIAPTMESSPWPASGPINVLHQGRVGEARWWLVAFTSYLTHSEPTGDSPGATTEAIRPASCVAVVDEDGKPFAGGGGCTFPSPGQVHGAGVGFVHLAGRDFLEIDAAPEVDAAVVHLRSGQRVGADLRSSPVDGMQVALVPLGTGGDADTYLRRANDAVVEVEITVNGKQETAFPHEP